MTKAFAPAIRKNPAFALFFGAALVWLFSSCWLSGKDWAGEVNLSPDKDANAYLKSGLQDLHSGARQLAVDKFTKAIQLDPSFALAYDARATARCQMKDYDGAIKDCEMVISLSGHDEHAYVIQGACHFSLHDIPGALKSLNKAISMNPDNAAAYYGRAAVEFSFEEYEKSLANVSRAIKLNGTLPDAYFLRAGVETHLKDRAGAFADANAGIELDTLNDRGYIDRANVEAMWDDFPDASNDLQTAILMNPTNPEIYLYRGALEQKCGHFQVALADFSRGLLNDKEPIGTDTVYESMGYDYAEMGQWQPALESFRKAMVFKTKPNDAAFQVFQIECRLGQTQQAKKELAVYIQSIPAAKAGDWTTSIAHFLAGTLNEADFLAQATTTAKRPTDVAMQTGDAWYYAGIQHLLAGDKAGALKRLKKSLKVGDDNSDNYTMARSVLKKN